MVGPLKSSGQAQLIKFNKPQGQWHGDCEDLEPQEQSAANRKSTFNLE